MELFDDIKSLSAWVVGVAVLVAIVWYVFRIRKARFPE